MLIHLLLTIVLLPLWRHVTPVERASFNSRRTNPNFLGHWFSVTRVVNSTSRLYIVRGSPDPNWKLESHTLSVPSVATNSDKRLTENVDIKNSTHSASLRYMEPKFSFTLRPSYHSKITANLSLCCRINEEGALRTCICTYICIYIRYSQTPKKRIPHLAPINVR